MGIQDPATCSCVTALVATRGLMSLGCLFSHALVSGGMGHFLCQQGSSAGVVMGQHRGGPGSLALHAMAWQVRLSPWGKCILP